MVGGAHGMLAEWTTPRIDGALPAAWGHQLCSNRGKLKSGGLGGIKYPRQDLNQIPGPPLAAAPWHLHPQVAPRSRSPHWGLTKRAARAQATCTFCPGGRAPRTRCACTASTGAAGTARRCPPTAPPARRRRRGWTAWRRCSGVSAFWLRAQAGPAGLGWEEVGPITHGAVGGCELESPLERLRANADHCRTNWAIAAPT